MNFDLQGVLIVKNDTQIISDKFKKREFVIEKKEMSTNGFEFVDTIKFQLTQDKCSLLDKIQLGENIQVTFNIRGTKWEKNGQVSYFVNLDAWRIESATGEQQASAPVAKSAPSTPPPPAAPPVDTDLDDLPF